MKFEFIATAADCKTVVTPSSPEHKCTWVGAPGAASGIVHALDYLNKGEEKNQQLQIKAAKAFVLGGFKDWRLGERLESESTFDLTRYSPTANEFFPGTKSQYHWTATECAWNKACAWVVGFGLGYVDSGLRDFGCVARAVRGPVPRPGQ